VLDLVSRVILRPGTHAARNNSATPAERPMPIEQMVRTFAGNTQGGATRHESLNEYECPLSGGIIVPVLGGDTWNFRDVRRGISVFILALPLGHCCQQWPCTLVRFQRPLVRVFSILYKRIFARRIYELSILVGKAMLAFGIDFLFRER